MSRGCLPVAVAQPRNHLSSAHGWEGLRESRRWSSSFAVRSDVAIFLHGDPHTMGNARDVEPKAIARATWAIAGSRRCAGSRPQEHSRGGAAADRRLNGHPPASTIPVLFDSLVSGVEH